LVYKNLNRIIKETAKPLPMGAWNGYIEKSGKMGVGNRLNWDKLRKQLIDRIGDGDNPTHSDRG